MGGESSSRMAKGDDSSCWRNIIVLFYYPFNEPNVPSLGALIVDWALLDN
jgi:hypothetical protein